MHAEIVTTNVSAEFLVLRVKRDSLFWNRSKFLISFLVVHFSKNQRFSKSYEFSD